MTKSAQDESRVLCVLAEHDAVLTVLADRMKQIENSISSMDDRLGRKVDATQQCLLDRIDRLDDRLRTVEKQSAVYGTTAGAIISTLITVGLNLLLGRNH